MAYGTSEAVQGDSAWAIGFLVIFVCAIGYRFIGGKFPFDTEGSDEKGDLKASDVPWSNTNRHNGIE